MSIDTDERRRVQEELYDKILLDQYLENDDIGQFRDEFLALHTYEQSEYFENTADENRQKIFRYLSPEEVADFFDRLDIDDDEYELLFDKMSTTYASHVLEETSYDNVVDILNKLAKPKVASLLALMDKDNANEVEASFHYDEDAAGGIMTTGYLSLKVHTPVEKALLLVKAQAPDAETVCIISAVNDDGKLVGALSLRDLIVAKNDAYAGDVMNERVVSVNVTDDQEDAAQVMRDYDFMVIPAIDYQDHLLGIITTDNILDVMDGEASEDYSHLVGVSDIDPTNDSIIKTALKRLPWLVILTFLGVTTAIILGEFERTLGNVALLAAPILITSGMSGDSDTQSLAVLVRNITTGEINEQGRFRIVLRETGSGVLSGVVCSTILFTIIVAVYHQPLLALIVAESLTYTMTVRTFVGSMIPLLMNKLNIDPAAASGPSITTISDIISMLIYFGLATSFMTYLI